MYLSLTSQRRRRYHTNTSYLSLFGGLSWPRPCYYCLSCLMSAVFRGRTVPKEGRSAALGWRIGFSTHSLVKSYQQASWGKEEKSLLQSPNCPQCYTTWGKGYSQDLGMIRGIEEKMGCCWLSGFIISLPSLP